MIAASVAAAAGGPGSALVVETEQLSAAIAATAGGPVASIAASNAPRVVIAGDRRRFQGTIIAGDRERT